MATITPNKTAAQTLLAHTQQATATVTRGSAVDVSSIFGLRYYIAMGRTVSTALTNEVNFRIEVSPETSGNDNWLPMIPFASQFGKTTASSTTINDAAVNIGDTSFVITSATGITAADTLYLRETGTPGNSEWVKVDSMSGTTVNCEALTRAHTNGINVADQAEFFTGSIDCSDIVRIRLVVDTATAASGQTVDIQAWYTTFNHSVVA